MITRALEGLARCPLEGDDDYSAQWGSLNYIKKYLEANYNVNPKSTWINKTLAVMLKDGVVKCPEGRKVYSLSSMNLPEPPSKKAVETEANKEYDESTCSSSESDFDDEGSGDDYKPPSNSRTMEATSNVDSDPRTREESRVADTTLHVVPTHESANDFGTKSFVSAPPCGAETVFAQKLASYLEKNKGGVSFDDVTVYEWVKCSFEEYKHMDTSQPIQVSFSITNTKEKSNVFRVFIGSEEDDDNIDVTQTKFECVLSAFLNESKESKMECYHINLITYNEKGYLEEFDMKSIEELKKLIGA